MQHPFCKIVPLDRYNWEQCLNIRIPIYQEEYVPSVMYSLAQAKFENLHPYGILYGDDMVGFLMYGEFSGICWINRFMIDESRQRQGIGRNALSQLLEMLTAKMRCKEIRTSYSSQNAAADAFFYSMGFQKIQSSMEDEIVAVYSKIAI